MPFIVSHTFDGPMAALEGVARDNTAQYLKSVHPKVGGVTLIFWVSDRLRLPKRTKPDDRYAAMVKVLNERKSDV